MKQEYVLPKLRLPGQPNWVMRGLWVAGLFVSVWVVILGVQLWRRGAAQPLTAQPPAATVPPVATAPAPASAAAKPKPGSVPLSAPKPGPAAPGAAKAAPGAGKGLAGKFGRSRYRGGRALRGRGSAWAKARGKSKVGGRRAALARKAYWRKKRLLAARGAGRPTGAAVAKAPAGVGGTSFSAKRPMMKPATGKAPVKTAQGKGDPIDEILRNFK